MKQFELTNESKINWFGRTLFRIKALIDFTTKGGDEIHAGDLGGYVEKEQNLSHDGKAWILDNAKVWGNAKIWGDAEVWGNAKVCGDASIFSTQHILNVTPIGINANSLTVFRAKNGDSLQVSFESKVHSLKQFKKEIDQWTDEKLKMTALKAVDLACFYIDTSLESPKD